MSYITLCRNWPKPASQKMKEEWSKIHRGKSSAANSMGYTPAEDSTYIVRRYSYSALLLFVFSMGKELQPSIWHSLVALSCVHGLTATSRRLIKRRMGAEICMRLLDGSLKWFCCCLNGLRVATAVEFCTAAASFSRVWQITGLYTCRQSLGMHISAQCLHRDACAGPGLLVVMVELHSPSFHIHN